MQGSVKWFSDEKGYGFLKADDGKDYFAHFTGINQAGFKTLEEGQRVSFTLEDNDRGPVAINVTVIEEIEQT